MISAVYRSFGDLIPVENVARLDGHVVEHGLLIVPGHELTGVVLMVGCLAFRDLLSRLGRRFILCNCHSLLRPNTYAVFRSLGLNAIRTSMSGTSARVNSRPIGS